MVDLTHCLTNLLNFDIPLLYYYTSFNSSIICCLSSGDMYLFLGVTFSASTSVSLFCTSFADFFETLVILSASTVKKFLTIFIV